MPEARPATPAFERFARETLGCRCDAEVFARVEEDCSPLPGLPEVRRRIAVGGRLLIYVAEAPDGSLATGRVRDWIAAGLAERNGRAMNRLRLVIALTDPSPAAVAAIESAFRGLPDLDDRVHLHVLAPESLVGL